MQPILPSLPHFCQFTLQIFRHVQNGSSERLFTLSLIWESEGTKLLLIGSLNTICFKKALYFTKSYQIIFTILYSFAFWPKTRNNITSHWTNQPHWHKNRFLKTLTKIRQIQRASRQRKAQVKKTYFIFG